MFMAITTLSGTPQLIFEISESKGFSGLRMRAASDITKSLKLQALPHHSWRLNNSFECKVSKIPWGVPFLCVFWF
jgi:hypothetical protein